MSGDQHSAEHRAVLVFPHVRVQNANAISSPMTWGFPAITAFTGMMTALERRLGRDAGVALHGVGVVCHGFEAQVTSSGYTRAFHLTRNPVLADGATAGIVEEGRVHLDVTLVFDARLTDDQRGDAERAALADRAAHELAGMRLAGGSVMPPLATTRRRPSSPMLALVPDGWQDEASDEQSKTYQLWFRRMARRWLPGFVLVSRDDLLQARWQELRGIRGDNTDATLLDAWLDLSRWSARAVATAAKTEPPTSRVDWVNDTRAGWTVPIPVGFASLTGLQPPGSVRGARDMSTPFRFVETVWSMGQWISPHRLRRLSDVVWAPDNTFDPDRPDAHALYRCVNAYTTAVLQTESATVADNIQH